MNDLVIDIAAKYRVSPTVMCNGRLIPNNGSKNVYDTIEIDIPVINCTLASYSDLRFVCIVQPHGHTWIGTFMFLELPHCDPTYASGVEIM